MRQYFYKDGPATLGPFTVEELRKRELSRETLVWCEGMRDWVRAENIPELTDLFEQIPPGQTSYSASRPPHAQRPDSYLLWSILATIFCFFPVGIAGIVNSCLVESRFNAGDVEGAYRASANAKKFTWWAVGIGLFLYAICIFLCIVAMAIVPFGWLFC